MTPEQRLAALGAAVPEILIPAEKADISKWAVIACDQFSSEPAYWEETARTVGSSPSTLNFIIPECYLEDGDKESRVQAANQAMSGAVEDGTLKTLEPGFILVDRSTPHAPSRKGLVMAVDLEAYDFAEGSSSAIRPTEGTIRDRLPPRMDIRRGASLDLPHILLLMDDPQGRVMAAAEAAADETVYDFDLMQNGGHITGRRVGGSGLEPLAEAFEALREKSDLLFAVGDGNHSLASAKEIWREKKAAGAPMDHPARYALVEVENIHDAGLHFHPIHRVLFDVEPDQLIAFLQKELSAEVVREPDAPAHLVMVTSRGEERWSFPVPEGRLAVEPLQDALDAYLSSHTRSSIDYIHGDDSVRELAGASADRLGMILPDLDKSSFFKRITDVGPYPRKTFSIGEAVEKRYYLESRRLS